MTNIKQLDRLEKQMNAINDKVNAGYFRQALMQTGHFDDEEIGLMVALVGKAIEDWMQKS